MVRGKKRRGRSATMVRGKKRRGRSATMVRARARADLPQCRPARAAGGAAPLVACCPLHAVRCTCSREARPPEPAPPKGSMASAAPAIDAWGSVRAKSKHQRGGGAGDTGEMPGRGRGAGLKEKKKNEGEGKRVAVHNIKSGPRVGQTAAAKSSSASGGASMADTDPLASPGANGSMAPADRWWAAASKASCKGPGAAARAHRRVGRGRV